MGKNLVNLGASFDISAITEDEFAKVEDIDVKLGITALLTSSGTGLPSLGKAAMNNDTGETETMTEQEAQQQQEEVEASTMSGDGTISADVTSGDRGKWFSVDSNGQYKISIDDKTTGKKLTVEDMYILPEVIWLDAQAGATEAIVELKKGVRYLVIFPENHEYEFNHIKVGEIEEGMGSGVPSSVEKLLNENAEDHAEGPEALVTRCFLAMGDVFLKAIRWALGSDLSIDALIFNRYNNTRLDFFSGEGAQTELNKVLKDVVNFWYNILLKFTYVVYLIILVYIGVMMIVAAGTPREDKVKTFFGNWVVGIAILSLLPYYGFPLLFRLNDALVRYVGTNSPEMLTYYNLEEKYSGEWQSNGEAIEGGDSKTTLIEFLEKKKEEEEGNRDAAAEEAHAEVEKIKSSISRQMVEYFRTHKGKGDDEHLEEIESAEERVNTFLKNSYSYYKAQRKRGTSESDSERIAVNSVFSEDADNPMGSYEKNALNKLTGLDDYSKLLSAYEREYQAEQKIAELEKDIKAAGKDIMGVMRSLAGSTERLVYAIIWFVLIFQMIGLTILYYKRVFVIAILIAIFPLIMLFYCIDKMADGAAQTLSMWFKEFLANIFIQLIHAIIYTVLVGMGLEIYSGGRTDWIFLVGALLFILPAEAIMKEIFDLNGSTLSKVAGTFSKMAMGVGAMVSLARAGKSEKDKSIKEANDKRMKRLQNSQNRADKKAQTRQNARMRDNLYTNPSGQAITGYQKFREGAYHVATEARQAYAKAAPKIGRTTRAVRNTAAVGVGLAYGLSGGDVESMAQGAAIAKGLSGKTSNADKKPELKTELKSAYKRQGKNP